MHLFLVWRAMEDRLSTIGHKIEYCLWGDSRARHTYLIACTDEHPLVLIEIDMGDHNKGIHKSMKLNITELEELPDATVKIVFIGETFMPNVLEHLLQSAKKYVKEHPNYHVLSNNCRTFVEYLIDQIPEFRDSVPRKHGSVLEYYHFEAKDEHPGALIKSKKKLKDVCDIHRHNRQYICAGKLVLNIKLPKLDSDNDVEIIETRF